jgi:hypothetical protein
MPARSGRGRLRGDGRCCFEVARRCCFEVAVGAGFEVAVVGLAIGRRFSR